MLKSIISTSEITLTTLSICTFVSIILGIVIALVHTKTSRYSKNFAITLCLLPVLVQIVMMMVNGNLGTSVAILGAFSLIRFRSMPGTSKEIISVFFAMAIGLATGTGYVMFAILMTITISAIIILLDKLAFKENNRLKTLTIVVPEDMNYSNMFEDVFKKYKIDTKLQKTKTVNMGSLFELTYALTYKGEVDEKKFIDDLRIKNCNLKITLGENNIGDML